MFEDYDLDVDFDDMFEGMRPEDLEHLEDFLEDFDGDMDLEDMM